MDYDRAVPLDEARRIGRVFGVLYLITFATSIPALWLFQPILDDPAGYVAGAGDDNRIFLGITLELLLIISNIGTALVPYPLLKRQNETIALGYVAARIVECTFILVGILAVLSVVTLQQEDAGGDEGALAYTLAALKDWTFLLGPGFVVGVGNGLMLGYLMYRSERVPPRAALLGLVGGPVLIVSGILVLFGVAEPGETLQGLATIPEALWELFLGVYCTIVGFRAAPILAGRHGVSRQAAPAVAGT